MSSSRTSMSVSPLTPTTAFPPRSPDPDIANILAFIHHLHGTLNGINNAPGELRALADDLGHAAAGLHQNSVLIPSNEYAWALNAVRDDLNDLEQNIMQFSTLLRRGWRTTIPNLQFARNCARLREKVWVDVQAVLALDHRASATSTIFEEGAMAATEEEEEERDVLTKLPPPVFVSKASRKWRRAVETEDDQEHLWSPVSAENMETAREGYARERREAMVRQIRTEDRERGETDLISIMATPTVLSFSAGLANDAWASRAMSVHHVEKSYFSPPPSSPVPSERKLAFVDTKGGVLVQTLPFLGVIGTSVVAIVLVRGASSLVLGFS
ncbi:hypothetical protein N0V82_009218 [Gnomoniopsis sp. IMI 355080]|nr:hypothetical protein N0V82_009218 [Gnomoniopsis sp. IMI 355080]